MRSKLLRFGDGLPGFLGKTREFLFGKQSKRANHKKLLPEKSGVCLSRQKNPDCMQQCLNLRAAPQGHGSLRPSFSDRCLSPWTTRTPRLTRVSDGNPRRRLLVRSKKGAVVMCVVVCHTASFVGASPLDQKSHPPSTWLQHRTRKSSLPMAGASVSLSPLNNNLSTRQCVPAWFRRRGHWLRDAAWG